VVRQPSVGVARRGPLSVDGVEAAGFAQIELGVSDETRQTIFGHYRKML